MQRTIKEAEKANREEVKKLLILSGIITKEEKRQI